MSIILSLLFVSMFIYVNTLYYSICLLAIILCLLYILVSNLMLSTLTMIMLCIVYIGAMMILIGYICAICPNLILVPNSLSILSYMLVLLVPYILFPSFSTVSFYSFPVPLVDYFYTYSGLVVFLGLVFMLFLTLLMVTSQYMTPKGPFRSVTI